MKDAIPSQKLPKTSLEVKGIVKVKKNKPRSIRLRQNLGPQIKQTIQFVVTEEHETDSQTSFHGEITTGSVQLPMEGVEGQPENVIRDTAPNANSQCTCGCHFPPIHTRDVVDKSTMVANVLVFSYSNF